MPVIPGRSIGTLALTLAFLPACDAEEEPVEPRLGSIQDRIFTPRCTFSSCHGGSSPVRGLDLRAGESHVSLVEVVSYDGTTVRVVPGDPEASLLVQVLEGPVGEIQRMPAGSALADGEIDAIRTWIDAGAADD